MALPTTLHIGDIVVHITNIQNDIDEEDRDAILVGIVVQNSGAQNASGVSLSIETSGAVTSVYKALPSSIPSGTSNEAMYFLPTGCGAWMLSVSHAGLRGELGPFPDGHRHVSEAPPLSKPITTTSANNPTMGGDAFADAFESALSSFGSEIIAGDTIAVDGGDPFAAAFMNSGAAQIRTSTPDTTKQDTPTPPPSLPETSKTQSEVTSASTDSTQESMPESPMGPPQGPPMGPGPMGPPQGPPKGPGPMGPPQGPQIGPPKDDESNSDS